MSTRRFARVPADLVRDEIEWLVIEPDEGEGWFLFFHRDLAEPSKYDSWYLTLEEALSGAAAWCDDRPLAWKSDDCGSRSAE